MANRTLRNSGIMEPVQVERALNHRVGHVMQYSMVADE
jgi:hypothetical protein